MNAPVIEAKKLANTEFPPTIFDIHSFGIIPFPPSGEPSKNPATNTPAPSKGIICLANPQLSPSHLLGSPSLKVKD